MTKNNQDIGVDFGAFKDPSKLSSNELKMLENLAKIKDTVVINQLREEGNKTLIMAELDGYLGRDKIDSKSKKYVEGLKNRIEQKIGGGDQTFLSQEKGDIRAFDLELSQEERNQIFAKSFSFFKNPTSISELQISQDKFADVKDMIVDRQTGIDLIMEFKDDGSGQPKSPIKIRMSDVIGENREFDPQKFISKWDELHSASSQSQ